MNDISEDPVLRSARREAALVMAIWLTACVYSLSYCYTYGYGRDAATLRYVAGFPDWVFWGVVVPWTACTAFSFVLAYYLIADDDLGEEQAEERLGGGGQEAEHA